MNAQLTLDYSKPLTNEEKFAQFHRQNPHVFELIERMAARKISEGATRIGIGHLCERLRYETTTQTVDAHSTFRVNNTYRAFYARLLIEKHPQWQGIIATREQVSR